MLRRSTRPRLSGGKDGPTAEAPAAQSGDLVVAVLGAAGVFNAFLALEFAFDETGNGALIHYGDTGSPLSAVISVDPSQFGVALRIRDGDG